MRSGIMNQEITVQVVDSDPDSRKAIEAVVALWGAKCQAYSSAEEYLQATPFDGVGCLLIDHRLSGIDGLALQQALLQRKETLPIIVVTAHATVPTTVRYVQEGAVSVIEKPYVADGLRQTVVKAVEVHIRRKQQKIRLDELESTISDLNARERHVMDAVVSGKMNKVIARDLELSVRTIENIRARVLQKFQAETSAQLAAKAIELQFLSGRMFPCAR